MYISCFFSSHGYIPFFRAIQPQLNSLKSFLNFQTPPVSPQHSKMEFRRATLPPLPPGGATPGGLGPDGRRTGPLNQMFHRTSTQNLLHRARKKTQLVISKRRSLPSNMTATAVMSPVLTQEQREQARRTTVNEEREDESEGDEVDVVPGVEKEDLLAAFNDSYPAMLTRSSSLPLDPKSEKDEYDTRSVTSDILPEGVDEQPGCVLS